MEDDGPLLAVLTEARRLGFLGPAPLNDHVAHARAYRPQVAGTGRGPLLDLGSGGGVPGLVLARDLPGSRWVLLDASTRRTSFLLDAVQELGLGDRVEVVTGRAESVGRRAPHRGAYPVVVARAFGRPAVVAECAAPFLAPGGRLVVSEPPDDAADRWPAEELRQLGLALEDRPGPGPRLAILRQEEPCPARFSRREGVPAKRPLW